MKTITEEDKVHLEWYETARMQEMNSVDRLAKFVTSLLTEYQHDYGTICHAIAAAGLAAMRVVDRDEKQGGITGFQAQCITWELLKHWARIDGPARIVQFDDMLFPQHADRFTQISASTWKRLQQNAREKVANGVNAHPDVIAHWKTIAAGSVPFGYTVEPEE